MFVEEEEMDNGIFRSELSQVATFSLRAVFRSCKISTMIVLEDFCEIDKLTRRA